MVQEPSKSHRSPGLRRARHRRVRHGYLLLLLLCHLHSSPVPIGGSAASLMDPSRETRPPPPHNVVNVGTETTLLHAESFFRILQRVEGEPEVLTASVRAACLCRCSCWHARNERGFNWFRKPQGRF